MELSRRVRLKSDRRARALILALCLAPVAAPLIAGGFNSILKASAAQNTTPAFDAPALRASLAPAPPSASPSPSPQLISVEPFLSPVPMNTPARLEPRPASKPQVASRARMSGTHVFREVRVIDGFQIAAEGLTIALAGIGPAPEGSECKRLDGVVEPCAMRAANRLDILTRGRPVACDLQEADDGRVRGVCRAGKIDLADDLVRYGLAVRTSDQL